MAHFRRKRNRTGHGKFTRKRINNSSKIKLPHEKEGICEYHLHTPKKKSQIYICKFCEKYFCKDHIRPKPPYSPNFKDASPRNRLLMEEYHKEGGHPCFPFLKHWEEEREEKSRKWEKTLNILAGKSKKQIDSKPIVMLPKAREPYPEQEGPEENYTLEERERKKKGAGKWIIFSIVLLIILLIIVLAELGVFSNQGSDDLNNTLEPTYNQTIKENISLDNFSNITQLHWGHMPVTYKLTGEPTEKQLNLITMAFSKIEEETSGLISFEEDKENPDITIYFDPANYRYDEESYIEGQALITEVDSLRNLILKGNITFYGGGTACNTGYPALEIHEILHLFKMPHSPLFGSIMGRYSAYSSELCTIKKIDPEYISCLKYIYSNGKLNWYTYYEGKVRGPCYFPYVVE